MTVEITVFDYGAMHTKHFDYAEARIGIDKIKLHTITIQ